jgi:hypothetical protein
MPITLTATNDDYIILTQNKINTFNEGTKILLKTHVISVTSGNIGENGENEDYDVLNAVNTRLPYLPNYTNNIILSYKNGTSINCLLTLNNIKNNIKFLFTDNNKKNGKILFVKNTNINNYELSNNYLLNTKTTSNLNINLAFQLNYHFNNIYSNSSSNFYNNNTINNPTNPNYDYYKINIKDYISRDYSYNFFGTTNDICYNNLYFKINSAHNNLYLDSDVSFRRLSDISNISQLRKVDNLSDFSPIYNNIYNKYTNYDEIKEYVITLRNFATNSTLTISFDTFLIRTNNFSILKQAQSKIIFDNNNTIYFSNVQVSTPQNPINFTTKILKPYIVYLSLGNFTTGLTQSDIYRHTHFTPIMDKITFVENINLTAFYDSVNVKKNYNTLQEYIDNQYLYDIELSYNRHLKHITINNIYTSANKIFSVNFSNFFDLSGLRNYYNNFNNLAFTSPITNSTRFIPNINYFNSANNYDTSLINFTIINDSLPSTYINKRNTTIETLKTTHYNLIKPALLDVRFNYDVYFNVPFSFNILYNYPNYNEIINNYSVNFTSLIYTTPSRDFTDVECIYIYHNPDTDPNPDYRYPNNNIEIIRDPSNNDTLSKAIELLPGASTSTSNSIIIPEKNGSNLSRKMIQGLIGLNNIPKLLSIKPYDANVIVGRGFINQYQIDEECNNSVEDIIKNKINANKHSSAKDSRSFTNNTLVRQNFANVVRSNRRNRLSQQCIEDLREDIRNGTPLATQVNYANIVPYTPRFKIFKTGQGHYL